MRIVKAARFLLRFGIRLDTTRLLIAIVVMLAGYAAMPLAALMFARFADEGLAHRSGAAIASVLLVALLLVAGLMGNHFAHQCYGRLCEHQRAALSVELIRLVNSSRGIEQHDDPRYADTLELVRGSVLVTTQALEALLNLGGLLLQAGITIAILATLDPWLILLPLFAVPAVLLGRRAQRTLENARSRCAEQFRLSNQLLEIATSPSTAMEARLFGAEEEILRRQGAAWDQITMRMWRGQAASAGLRALGQVAFAVGYAGAVLLVVRNGLHGRTPVGELILVIALAIQVNAQVAGALRQLAGLAVAGDTVERLDFLRDYGTAQDKPVARESGSPGSGTPAGRDREAGAPARVPRRLRDGITLERVSFAYPGTSRPVLDDVSLTLPAGSTVALVGENGAGKSTLVKLLCGLYAPASGRILVDGADLADLPAAQWRARIAALFQDYSRFELTLRESVGIGDVRRLGDEDIVRGALAAAVADDLESVVHGGLAGYVGKNYTAGTELSGGQWQRLALARSLMREDPLLLVLDEPAAALDPTAEHAIFERYASSAGTAASELGGVTLLISHRFSTVLMADQIAVLQHGRLVEHGPHRRLMADDGLYAELFMLQGRAYR